MKKALVFCGIAILFFSASASASQKIHYSPVTAGKSAAWLEEVRLETGDKALRVKLKQNNRVQTLQSFAYQGELLPEDILSIASSEAGVVLSWLGRPEGLGPPDEIDPNANVTWPSFLAIVSSGKVTVHQLGEDSSPVSVSIDSRGEVSAIWSERSEEWQVTSKTFHPSGSPKDTRVLATTALPGKPQIGSDNSGRDFAAWEEEGGLMMASRAGDRTEWEEARSLAAASEGFNLDVSRDGIASLAWREPSPEGHYVHAAWLESGSSEIQEWSSPESWENASVPSVRSGVKGNIAAAWSGSSPARSTTSAWVFSRRSDGTVTAREVAEDVSLPIIALDNFGKWIISWSDDISERVYWLRSGGVKKSLGSGFAEQIAYEGCGLSFIWLRTTAYNTAGWFTEVKTRSIPICPSLAAQIKGPRRVIAGGKARYSITAQNLGQEAVEGARLVVRMGRYRAVRPVSIGRAMRVSVPAYQRGRKRVLFSLQSKNAKTKQYTRVLVAK